MSTKRNRSKARKKGGAGRSRAAADRWARARRFILRRPVFLLPLAIVGLATLVTGLALERSTAKLIYSEGQLVENATVLLYGVALALLLGWAKGERELRLLVALVVALCAFRELDLHKAYTSESLLKISYYLEGDDPILGRILAGIVLVAILALLIRTLVYCRNLWTELRAGQPFAFSALAAILLLPLSKALDSSPRMIHKHLGIQLPSDLRFGMLLAEETLEMAVPLLIILGVAQYNAAKHGET